MEQGSSPREGGPLAGRSFYSPEVLLAYFALGGLPAGVFLYGINAARRGQPRAGYLLAGLAAAAFSLSGVFSDPPLAVAFMLSGVFSGVPLGSAMSIFIGIGVLRSESGFFRTALAGGATEARWWPPAVLGIVVALAVPLAMALLLH